MKKGIPLLFSLLLFSNFIFAATITSNGTGGGSWSTGSTWQGGVAPLSSDDVIILAGDVVTLAGGTRNTGTSTTIGGTLILTGGLTVTGATVTVSNGGVVELAYNSPTAPACTWNVGSTLRITGLSGTTGSSLGGMAQAFHHVTWNCPSQGATYNMAIGSNVTWSGDFTIVTSNSQIVRFTSTSGVSVTINGTTSIQGTSILQGTGSGSLTGLVFNFNNLSISNTASFLPVASSSTATVNVSGNLSILNTATLSKGSGAVIFNFNKAGTQTFTKSSGATISNGGSGAYTFNVTDGATLDMGTSIFNYSATNPLTFNVQSGGGLKLGDPAGLTATTGSGNNTGNIQLTGASGVSKSFSSAGNYEFNGTGAQVTGPFLSSTTPIANTVSNLTINNSSGVTLSSAVTVANILAINSGSTLTTGTNNLTLGASASATVAPNASLNITGGLTDFANRPVTLQSTSGGTASIGTITGNNITTGLINATNVTLQRYIPGGKRAFRFFGHPFSTALNLSALTDNILITGGAGTGFTSSTSNNPSAFWYNPATGNASTTNDPGWTAFTTANGTGGAANIWSQYEGIRVLVRGSIADGLSPVTPSPVTLDATGTLNTGTQTIAVTKGTNSGFNLIANPFASNINLTTVGGNVTLGSNLVTNHYVWDISAGTKGGWVNTAFSSSYVLPSFSAFFVKTSANDNISITEAAKTSVAATGTLFRNTNALPQMVRLWVLGNNITWDKFELYYNKESVLENDKHDGVKMFNSEVNLYSLNNSGMYSIDSRPCIKDDIIPLGFTSAVQQTYTIKATDFNMPAGVELYLRDKFLGTETKLVEDAEYTFSVTSNPASQGNARFEIAQKAAPLQPIATSFYVKLSPNPAKGMVKVSFNNEEVLNTQITIINAEGKIVKQVNAGNVQAANLNININDLARGMYYVTLQNGKEKKTEVLQVQ
jgi:hypothetical protein